MTPRLDHEIMIIYQPVEVLKLTWVTDLGTLTSWMVRTAFCQSSRNLRVMALPWPFSSLVSWQRCDTYNQNNKITVTIQRNQCSRTKHEKITARQKIS